MGRVAREEKDKAAIVIAGTSVDGPGALVAHLRRAGHLTVGFAFRAVLCGRTELLVATLSELSGVSRWRGSMVTSRPLREHRLRRALPQGGAAAGPAAGLPHSRCAPCARPTGLTVPGASLSRRVIERVLDARATPSTDGELDKLLVLLRRFEAEAAREEARLSQRCLGRRTPLTLTAWQRGRPARTAPAHRPRHHPATIRRRRPSGRPASRTGPALRSPSTFSAIEAELCAA